MPKNVDELVDLLSLERIEADLFRGRSQESSLLQRAFGGQVMAQALEAAYQTVPDDRMAHSLHAYFLRPGHTASPIIYDVDFTRDGGTFSLRHVKARQVGQVIFVMDVSFKLHEPGLEHQWPPTPGVPEPDDCPPLAEVLAARSAVNTRDWADEWGALEVRYAGDARKGDYTSRAAMQVWVRTDGPLPDSPRLHQEVLAYLSDITLLGVSTVGHPVTFMSRRMQTITVDHATWFHRPIRADEWVLYDQFSPSASNGLGYSRGRLYADGVLGASTAQEGLIRVVEERRKGTDPAAKA